MKKTPIIYFSRLLKQFSLIAGVFIIVFTGCQDDDLSTFEPSFVKIYINDEEMPDVLVTDVFPLQDNGVIVFGIAGNDPATRIDGNGWIYVQKINPDGKKAWENYLKPFNSGFPTNFIQTGENEFTTFWNVTTGTHRAVKLTVGDGNNITTDISTISLDYEFNTGFVTYAIENIAKDGYILLNISEQQVNQQEFSKSFLTEIDQNYQVTKKLARQEFVPNSFGAYGDNETALIEELFPYFYIGKDHAYNRYYFSAPVGKKMALMYVGDSYAIYQDSLYWIAALQSNPDNQQAFSLVLNTPNDPGGMTDYVSEIVMYPNRFDYDLINKSHQIQEILDMDVNNPVFLLPLSSKTIVAGTSNSGQVVLTVYKNDENRTVKLGQTFTYQVAGIVQSVDKKHIIVAGTTKVEHQLQRVFLIKIPIDEL